MDKYSSQVDLIREAFHYQSRFADSTMVFKVDFPVLEHPLFPSLVKDMALLSQTGFRLVIVPGAREWIDSVLGEYDITSQYNGSKRITSSSAMPFVEMAAFHTATRFMTGFSGSRIDAVIRKCIWGRGLGVVEGVDMQHTGTVDKIYAASLSRVLELGMVPILPCIGRNSTGKPYNVLSTEIALQTAASLKASKLFIISLSGGINLKHHKIPDGIEIGGNDKTTRLSPHEALSLLEINPAGAIRHWRSLSLQCGH